MPIYTKKGDKGETGLPGGKRLSKTENIFQCLGALDQTNALIGLAISLIDQKLEPQLIKFLELLQGDLLFIGSTIATTHLDSKKNLQILNKRTANLEEQIDKWDRKLLKLQNFILPGGCQAASTIHLTRVSVRESERIFHRLQLKTDFDPIAMYLNRLSDYFFQCARYLNMRSKNKEVIWKITNKLS